MKTEIEVAVVKDLEERAAQAKGRREAYARGSSLWAEFDGRYWALIDIARSIRQGDYEPLQSPRADRRAA